MNKESKKIIQISRRKFLLASSLGLVINPSTGNESLPDWMKTPGSELSSYGTPSLNENKVKRTITKPFGEQLPGNGASTSPLEHMEGVITPNGLHFERHHILFQ